MSRKSFSELLQLDKKKKLNESLNNFEDTTGGRFTETENIIFSQKYNSTIAVLDSMTEFGVSFKIGANELKENNNLSVLVSCDFLSDDNKDVKMVATTDNMGKAIYYQSYLFKDYCKKSDKMEKVYFYFVLPKFKNQNDILSIYLWNPTKTNAMYDNFKVVIYNTR